MKFFKKAACIAVAGLMCFATACGGNTDNSSDDNGGNKVNKSDFPLYVEDYENLQYSADGYAANMSAPYWKSNVVYNEITLPLSYDDGTAYAKLNYKPLKVVSVLDQTLQKTYVEGRDYVVDSVNKRLVIPEGSSIPTLYEKADEGINPPDGIKLETSSPLPTMTSYVVWNIGNGPFAYTEGPYFYPKYLSVTYAYDIAEVDQTPFAKYDKFNLTKVRAKLESGEGISLVTLGDSITQGCSSTGDVLNIDPATPCYAKQFKAELERLYNVDVSLYNGGVGGKQSDYPTSAEGTAVLSAAKLAKPDLCVIAFGMNDMSAKVEAVEFDDNIRKTMTEIKNVSPDCEFILINSFPCNPRYEQAGGYFTKYLNKLNTIASEYEDGSVVVLDMQKVGKTYLDAGRKYCEISSSNVNHPNDFMHRIYAMNLSSLVCDYKNK